MSFSSPSDPRSRKARIPIAAPRPSRKWLKSQSHFYQSFTSYRSIQIQKHLPRFKAVSLHSKAPSIYYTSYDPSSTWSSGTLIPSNRMLGSSVSPFRCLMRPIAHMPRTGQRRTERTSLRKHWAFWQMTTQIKRVGRVRNSQYPLLARELSRLCCPYQVVLGSRRVMLEWKALMRGGLVS